ncbi:molecular chaperone, partial [Mycolicibacterium duvalii]
MRASLGLSLGAANLAAVADGRPTVRRAVLTVSAHHPPQLGVPAAPGLPMTGFVDRVGDPVPLVAADGSTYRADTLTAMALEALTRAARPQRRPDCATVAVPAHWSPSTIAALRARVPHLGVVSDAVAALTALQVNPGLPGHGVVALCDFGATGSSITLTDAAHGFAPIGPTVRDTEFSGELIDQALLRHALSGLDLDPAGTAEVASLIDLRDRCRGAKERLSADTAAGLVAAGSTIRVTRGELESLIADPLDRFIRLLQDTLRHAGIVPAQVSAIATVGGGARIPAVTERLSQALRIPVVTTVAAQIVAAAGAELIAHRSAYQEPPTMLAPLPMPAPEWEDTMAAMPLAWSAEPPEADSGVAEPVGELTAYARPDVRFDEFGDEQQDFDTPAWYRRPGVLFSGAACLAALAATGLLLTTQADSTESVAAGTSGIEAPVASQPIAPPPAPGPATVTEIIAAPPPQPVPAAAQVPLPQRQAVEKQAASPPAPPPAAPAPAPVVVPPAAPAPTPSPSPTPTPTPTPSPTPSPSPTPT